MKDRQKVWHRTNRLIRICQPNWCLCLEEHAPVKVPLRYTGERPDRLGRFWLRLNRWIQKWLFVSRNTSDHEEAAGQRSTFPLRLAEWFTADGERYSSVVVDCLTLWLNNLLRDRVRPAQVLTHVRKFLLGIRAFSGQMIVVSNELGLGLVPGDAISRSFRDVAGRMNQLVAAEADEVYFLVSGLPLRAEIVIECLGYAASRNY